MKILIMSLIRISYYTLHNNLLFTNLNTSHPIQNIIKKIQKSAKYIIHNNRYKSIYALSRINAQKYKSSYKWKLNSSFVRGLLKQLTYSSVTLLRIVKIYQIKMDSSWSYQYQYHKLSKKTQNFFWKHLEIK